MDIEKFVQENYDIIMKIINCMKVGIWITDNKGKVLMINDESLKTGGLKREELIGRTTEELLEAGYILYESSVLNAINNRDEASIIQELGEGGSVLATSVPLFEKNKMSMVICTERNITETIKLRELLKKQKALSDKYESEITHIRKQEIQGTENIVFTSSAMNDIIETAIRIAKMNTTIMITGESGTGKEMIAKLIYEHSERRNGPFIKVNCAAIPENLMESEFFGYEEGAFTGAVKGGKIGFFEMANDGTLFLDEIGDLPFAMQPKLLRAIQEKEIMRVGGDCEIPVDVRIISATNRNLKNLVANGNFREDLYYRLNVALIEITPLRERKEDIQPLAERFVTEFNEKYGMSKNLTSGGISALKDYNWPGNIRELRNIVERIIVAGESKEITSFQVIRQLSKNNIDSAWLKEEYREKNLKHIIEDLEKSVLEECLSEEGNITKVAEVLNVNKSTISRKFKKYNINI